MFEASLVNDTARTSRPYTVSFSALLQVLAATVAVTYPLWHIEPLPRIPLRAPSPFRNAIPLVDPRPAASQPPRSNTAATIAVPTRPRIFIPDARQPLSSATPASTDIDTSGLPVTEPGDPNGMFVPGAIHGSGGGQVIATPKPPPVQPAAKPTEPKVTGPVRPGGVVRQPQLLREVKPVYPALARQARIQGTVRIEAIISREGLIRDARVVSGHPLLIAAALDAVRQWQYRPTSLNGDPVEVALALEVNFTLSQH